MGDTNDIKDIIEAKSKINEHLDAINKIRRELTQKFFGLLDVNIEIEKVRRPPMLRELYEFEAKISLDIKK